jgi:hypothetical protein
LLHAQELVSQVRLGFLAEKRGSIVLGKERVEWDVRLLHYEVVLLVLDHLWLGNSENCSSIIVIIPSIGTFRNLKVVITGIKDVSILSCSLICLNS